MKIFGGSNSLELAKEVASLAGGTGRLSESEITRFISSEIKVRIDENVEGEDCVVIQTTSSPSNDTFMELFFFCDALKRSGAKTITVATPYLGYVRQNKQHTQGECVSIEVIATIFNALPIDRVITFDLHEKDIIHLFKAKLTSLTAFSLLAQTVLDFIASEGEMSADDFVIVAPDKGSIVHAQLFGEAFFGSLLGGKADGADKASNQAYDFQPAVIDKVRPGPNIAQAISLNGDVEGKKVLVVDDIITTGGTLSESVRLLTEHGAAEIYNAFTHPDFTPETAIKLHGLPIKHFFTTNSIRLTPDHMFKNLTIVSLADILYRSLEL